MRLFPSINSTIFDKAYVGKLVGQLVVRTAVVGLASAAVAFVVVVVAAAALPFVDRVLIYFYAACVQIGSS